MRAAEDAVASPTSGLDYLLEAVLLVKTAFDSEVQDLHHVRP